jgi:hypothetical protein
MNEGLPQGEHSYVFVGKVGAFYPMKPGTGGGELFRMKDEKYFAVTGTKGYRWMEASVVKTLGKERDIDMLYYERLAKESIDDINKFGDFNWFVSDAEEPMYSSGETIGLDDVPPWLPEDDEYSPDEVPF